MFISYDNISCFSKFFISYMDVQDCYLIVENYYYGLVHSPLSIRFWASPYFVDIHLPRSCFLSSTILMSTTVICHVDNFLLDILAATGSSTSRSSLDIVHNFEFFWSFFFFMQKYRIIHIS